MAFLTENPEYESYLPEYDSRISLNGNNEYNHKDLLKKDFADVPEITSVNFEEFCIAWCEGLLEDIDRKRFSEFLETHPEKKKDFDLYTRIKLKPDASVVFADKSRLKKNAPIALKPRFIQYALGIAASLTLLLVLIIRKPAETYHTQTPQKEEMILPVVTPNQVISVPESENSSTLQAYAPVKNEAKKTPVDGLVPMIPETAADDPVLLPLESIGAKAIMAESVASASDLPRMGSTTNPFAESGEIAAVDDPLSSNDDEGLLRTLINRVDIWKTAEKAIQGFNYLTEANLNIDKTLDENGRMSAILLNMDSYRISGNKIK
jgi:hypothetical protein